MVDAAAQIHNAGHAGGADRHVDQPVAPRTPERVGDDHAERDTQTVLETLPDVVGACVGVLGKEGDHADVQVRSVDPGVRTDESVPGLGDHHVSPPRNHANGLRCNPPAAVGPRHQAAFRLRNDLRGDGDHVPILGPEGAKGSR